MISLKTLLAAFSAAALLVVSSHVSAATKGEPSIIPKPLKIVMLDEAFAINQKTIVSVPADSDELMRLGLYLAEVIGTKTGSIPQVKKASSNDSLLNTISLRFFSGENRLGDEGYTLDITKERIVIMAPKGAGIFYGIQSLKQIIMSEEYSRGTDLTLQGVSIEDSPAFKWRGMMMDCSRHYMTKDFIKRYIDLLAFHKLNVFHWHLTDDQGWRLAIKRYPELTKTGAWRFENGGTYGGFYTQEDAREIIEYASNRYITVVPEIEMPGHATAAIAAYPELSCEGKKIDVQTEWGIHTNLFCTGKESTFEFLENVLTEVAELFPSHYIHIGGDEAKKDKWKVCPACQKRIKDEGLKDENALQGYFTRRIDEFMRSRGKIIIGWDEILEGDPSKTAIVQSWRGMEGAIEGSDKGYYVISSPHTHTYFDYPMADEGMHQWWMPILPLEKQYQFTPAPDELSADQKAHVIGGECTIWSEHAPQPEVDYKVFPRLCSFSECVWTAKENKSYDDFTARLEAHYKRLDSLGVDHYTPGSPAATWAAGKVAPDNSDIEFDVTGSITRPGHYCFTVRQDSGKGSVEILGMLLLENGVQIAQDIHRGGSGTRNEDQNYRFDVAQLKSGAKYSLKATMRTDGGTDSKGTILVRYFTFQ